MPTLLASPPEVLDLEERIAAFERAWARDGSALLADFLPPINHAGYREVLGELIRVEIELLWNRRTPKPLDAYLSRFPVLQSEPALFSAIAFEDYRQRIQAGERTSADEYHARYGVDLSVWPAKLPLPESDDMQTNAMATADVADALVGVARSTEPEARATKLPEDGDIVLRRFRIKERLGKGAFGSVYLAERLDLFNRPVALKFLPGPSVEPEMLAQLIHENVVPIESVDRYGSMLVICMPYRGRTTLQHIVDTMPRDSIGHQTTGRLFLSTLLERSASRKSGTIVSSGDSGSASGSHRSGSSVLAPDARTLAQLDKLAGMTHVEASLRIVLGIASGLAHAHEHNIVHRDLKPANVLLADDGTPMVLDFNLATQIRKEQGIDCVRMGGTFPYMSPEQIVAARDKHECRDPRSDLYSLGVLMFELLAGQLPFPKVKRVSRDFLDQLLASRLAPLPDVCSINPAVTRSIADILGKLLAFDADSRYQTARDVKEDLERHLANLPLAHARESSRRARLAKFRRRHPRLSTALTVGFAASLLLFLPAGLITGIQGYSAYRLGQRERAEARLLLDESRRDAWAVQTSVYSRTNDSRLFQISRDRAEALARRYELEASDWAEKSGITRLNENERQELFTGMGDAFLALSRATEEHGRDTHDLRWQKQAERWRRLADDVLRKAGRQSSDMWKHGKAPESPERTGAMPDLARLDDADLYRLAGEMISESRFRQAVTLLDELLIRKPQHFMAWYWKAGCLDNLGHSPAALQAWETCVALEPEFAACHQNLGIAAYRCQAFARAERAYSEAYRLEPKLVNALVNRAMCRSQLKRWNEAESDLTLALAQDAAPTVIHFLRSDVRRKQGRTQEADVDFAEGMKREPQDEWSYSMRGYYRALQAKPDAIGALADLDKALQINPRNYAALNNRMAVLTKLGRLPAAVASADLLLSYYPEMLPVRATRGVLLARQGDAKGAIKEAEYCLSAAPPNAFLYYQVGSVYAALSRHDEQYKTRAFDLLRASIVNGMNRPDLFQTDADLDAIRRDERFLQLAAYATAQAELKHRIIALP